MKPSSTSTLSRVNPMLVLAEEERETWLQQPKRACTHGYLSSSSSTTNSNSNNNRSNHVAATAQDRDFLVSCSSNGSISSMDHNNKNANTINSNIDTRRSIPTTGMTVTTGTSPAILSLQPMSTSMSMTNGMTRHDWDHMGSFSLKTLSLHSTSGVTAETSCSTTGSSRPQSPSTSDATSDTATSSATTSATTTQQILSQSIFQITPGMFDAASTTPTPTTDTTTNNNHIVVPSIQVRRISDDTITRPPRREKRSNSCTNSITDEDRFRCKRRRIANRHRAMGANDFDAILTQIIP